MRVSMYFCNLKITQSAKGNFERVIAEGRTLVGELNSLEWANDFYKSKIENFMIACEQAIYTVGLEDPHEYCEIIEILDDFRDERLLLMHYINKKTNDNN